MSDQAADEYPFFSKELIDRWTSLPTDKPLAVPLGRIEIDNLVLSIRQSIIAQSHAAVAMRHFIDGNQQEGADTWELYQRDLHSSFDHINNFMRHVMASATVLPADE